MIRRAYLVAGVLLIGLIQACDGPANETQETSTRRLSDAELAALPKEKDSADELLFGFDLRASPQEDARQYLPFLQYLKQATGYNFKLRFTPQDGKIVNDLGKGVVQLAALGATSYIKAHEKYGVIPLVRGRNSEGKAEYRSMLIVRPESPLKSLTDLYGRKMAFGSRTSTQGHLIPRIILQQHNISLNDFSTYEYTGSHQNCADAVISGHFDVCGLQDTMAEDLARRKLVRILFTSRYFPSSGIVANRNLPTEVLERIRKALLAFDPAGAHHDGLYHWDKTEMPLGFVSASDKDYEELRHWMKVLRLSLPDTLKARLELES